MLGGTQRGYPRPLAATVARALAATAVTLCAPAFLVASAADPSAAVTLPVGEVEGMVSYEQGGPAAGVQVDLFAAPAGAGQAELLQSVETGSSGRYSFDVDDGCFAVVLVAPDGAEVAGGGPARPQIVCVTGGQAGHQVDGVLRRALSSVSGSVTTSDGGPAKEVIIDLFKTTSTGERAEFVTSTTTDADGRYTLGLVAAGCYLLIFPGPAGAPVAGASRNEPTQVCLNEGESIAELGAVVASGDEGQIRGHISFENGASANGARVDLYAVAGDGSRGPYLRSTATDSGGWYSLDVVPACYAVLMSAPEGEVFATGEATQLQSSCVTGGGPVAPLDGVLAGAAHLPTSLSAVELELIRLTNELRADPSGPLARRSPMPPCVDDTFNAIAIDPASGHPSPSPALAVDEQVSVEMARAWAVEMQQRSDFGHRPSPSQEEVYDQLGVEVAAWGENIAWLAGFGPEEAARIHFEGWRESDTGHYCTLLSARFTHVGVGEHRVGDESWAVQNYYQPR